MHPIVQKWLPRIKGTQINAMSMVMPARASQKAFNLFCTPRKGRLRPKDQRYLDSAENILRVNTPYGKIQTYSWNASGKQTILLAHGWESNSARWRFLISHLIEQDYHVVALDAPAHGQSEGSIFHMPKYAESIHYVMQSYRADYVIGHSIGGMATAYYMTHYKHPELAGVIMMDAPSEFENMLKKFADFLKLSRHSMKVIYRFLEKQFGRHPSYFSINTFCTNLTVPTLIIHDEGDKVVPFKATEAYLANFENAKLLRTTKLGHSLQDKSVFNQILHFVEREEVLK